MEFSEFFSEKINGFDRFGNELKFDYTQYNHETIKLFLDLLHGISIRFGESRHTAWYLERVIPRLVELLGFLAYEGKNGTGSYLKLVLILTSEISDFEKQLQTAVKEEIDFILHVKGVKSQTEILLWLAFGEIEDNYDFYEVL